MFVALILGLVLGYSETALWRAWPHQALGPPGIRPTNLNQDPPLPVRQARTPMSSAEARLHLELAYRVVVGRAPDSKTLSLLLAQWALETGRGGKMWGFNFGGIKASSGGARLATRESFGIGARQVTHRFRTYRSAIEGARDYVQTLTVDFPKAFVALHSGCATDFVRALSDEGYFTGNSAVYGRAISLLAIEYERG